VLHNQGSLIPPSIFRRRLRLRNLADRLSLTLSSPDSLPVTEPYCLRCLGDIGDEDGDRDDSPLVLMNCGGGRRRSGLYKSPRRLRWAMSAVCSSASSSFSGHTQRLFPMLFCASHALKASSEKVSSRAPGGKGGMGGKCSSGAGRSGADMEDESETDEERDKVGSKLW